MSSQKVVKTNNNMQDKIQELSALIESMQTQIARARLLLTDMGAAREAILSGGPSVLPTANPVASPVVAPVAVPSMDTPAATEPIPYAQVAIPPLHSGVPVIQEAGGQVVEGLFDGQNMAGPDGKVYNVPANYASKSKLVEGDQMKLTISRDGSFLYKQIGPVERTRVKGTLTREDGGNGYVMKTESGRAYKVLLASVTYFKGQVGDMAVAFMPEHGQSAWAAVEHIIPKDQVTPELMSEMMEEGEVELQGSIQPPPGAIQIHEGNEGLLTSGEEALLN
ncbi:MAG: hypothetical protein AAB558_01215 [Patescibacteria group bacterium]